MAISRRTLLAGSTAVGLGAAAAIVGYRLMQQPAVIVSDEPGLVGLWMFDEGEGDVVRDASGFRNDGAVVRPNGGAARGSGEFGGSVSLGGADGNIVRVPASLSLNGLSSAITVVAYAYPRRLWMPGDPGDGHIALVQRQWRTVLHPDLFYLGYGPSGGALAYKWHVGLTTGEPSIYARTEARTPTVDRWVHLAGVFDGTTGDMSLYVDGDLIASRSEKGRLRLDLESAERPLMIGGELNSASLDQVSSPFDGYVDEVRIYDRALTGAEVIALAPKARKRG